GKLHLGGGRFCRRAEASSRAGDQQAERKGGSPTSRKGQDGEHGHHRSPVIGRTPPSATGPTHQRRPVPPALRHSPVQLTRSEDARMERMTYPGALVLAFAAGLFAACPAAARAAPLVEKGQPRAVIVLPEKPSPAAERAARVLRDHVKQIS